MSFHAALPASTLDPSSRSSSALLPAPRRRKRPFLLGGLFFIAVSVLSAVVLLLCPPVLAALSAIFLKPQPGIVPWNGHDRITVVAMGLTQRTTEPARTDTLLAIDIDPAAHRIHMLSVPRDLWVPIPGSQVGAGKLAIAYAIGGPRLAAYTLEKSLGIPVDYTVAMTFRGFMKLIDAMGGVTVNVPQAIDDPTYPCLVGYDYCPLHLKAGVQHLDGKTALEFVRERHSFSQQDLARVQNQQAFSNAVRSTLMTPTTWPRLPTILHTLQDSLITNVPFNDLPVMGAQFVVTPKSRVDHNFINVNNGMVKFDWSADGQSILTPTSPTVIPILIHRLFDDSTLAQENASIAVLNGTSTGGLASEAQGTLTGLGYHVTATGNADRSDYARCRVIVNTSVGGAADYTARRLQRILNADLTSATLPGQSARIVVILGSNFPVA